MSVAQPITQLSEVAHAYDAVLCDIWGVLHNGRESWPSAYQAIKAFKESRGPVILISNSPRPRADLIAQLSSLGVPEDSYTDVVSSGDATRFELEARRPGPAFAIGHPREKAYYDGLGLALVEDPKQAAFISCTGLFDDETEVPEDYRTLFEPLAAARLPFVCANPDRIVQRGSKIIYCAGALADLYAELGGQVIMAGKPYRPIYDLAFAKLQDLMGTVPAPDRILAIGDGLPTDILGANQQGLDALFIAAGIHVADAMTVTGELSFKAIDDLLAKEGLSARYVAPRLA